MKCAIVALALISLASGLAAAWFWYQSARKKPPELDMIKNAIRGASGLTPVEEWLLASGKNNRIAAALTAITTGTGSIATVLGVS